MSTKARAINELAPNGLVMMDMQDHMDMVADVQRLEWLVMNNARVWLQDGWYDLHDDGGNCIVHMKESWREAIDEAMRAEW